MLSELLAGYVAHLEAQQEDSRELKAVRGLARMIAEAISLVHAQDFGPRRLQLIRALGVEQGWSRKYANAQMHRARRFFRWGVERETVPSWTLEGLKALSPLKAGKCNARENPPRLPVSEHDFLATIAELGDVPRDLCRVLWATGMRPGEASGMRVGDLDMSESPWRYHLSKHKTVEATGVRVLFLESRPRLPSGPTWCRTRRPTPPVVSIHAPAWRATGSPTRSMSTPSRFNPRPRMEGDVRLRLEV